MLSSPEPMSQAEIFWENVTDRSELPSDVKYLGISDEKFNNYNKYYLFPDGSLAIQHFDVLNNYYWSYEENCLSLDDTEILPDEVYKKYYGA